MAQSPPVHGPAAATGLLPQRISDVFGAWTTDHADDHHVYQVSAGAAVHAELRLPDGTTYPAVLVDGWSYGWFPTASVGDPVLTGTAADGSTVGRFSVPRLR